MESMGAIVYFVIVVGLILLFCLSFAMFIRTLLRNSSSRRVSSQRTEQLLEEQNELLRELLAMMKQKS